jgi:hypothetical protein
MREEFISKIQYLIGEYGYKFLCSTDQRYSSPLFQKILELKILLDFLLNTDDETLYTRNGVFPFVTRPYKESSNEYYATLAEQSAQQAEVYYTESIDAAQRAEEAADIAVNANQDIEANREAAELAAQQAIDAKEAAEISAQNSLNSANAAAQSASNALASELAAEADKVQTGLDRIATGQDRVQTGLDRVATGQDVLTTNQNVIISEGHKDDAEDAAILATQQAILSAAARDDAEAYKIAAQQAAGNALVSENNAEDYAAAALASQQAAALDAIQTAADRVQTGLDRQATAADRIQTALDVQTTLQQAGIATTQAGNALTSANNALNSANAAAASASSASQTGTSTLLTGFSTGANTTILGTDSILEAFQKAQGQINARVSGTLTPGQIAFGLSNGVIRGVPTFSIDAINSRMGVGVALPLETLHVSSGTNSDLGNFSIMLGGSIKNARALLISKNTTPPFDFNIFGSLSATNVDINFFTSNVNNRFSIKNTGEIGIATTSPTQTLDVNGTGRIRNGVSLADTSGNVQIGTTTDSGFKLDVNGTARVQGALTTNLTAGRVPFIGTGGVLSSSANLLWDDSISRLEVSALQGIIRITGGTSSAIGQKSASLEFFSTDTSVQSGSTGARVRAEIATVYDNAGGGASSLVFYTQNGSTDPVVERWRIGMAGILESLGSQTIRTSTGDLTIATNGGNGNIVLNPNGSGTVSITDAKNIALGTTTGTKIATATSQKLGLWNATPIVQPTTSVAGATRVGGGGTTLTDTDTFDGYTLAQIVKALRNMGALA